jgi:hypothetical protein
MRQKYLAVVFPITIIGLMLAERLATFLLGSHPAEPALWAISLELRTLFRVSAGWLEIGTGDSIIMQIGLLIAAIAILFLAMGTRRWATLSFLVNHAALLLVGTAALMASSSTIASSGGPLLMSGHFLFTGVLQLSAFHSVVLTLGLVGCASCHYLFLAQKAANERVLAIALKKLAFNLEGRRAAR